MRLWRRTECWLDSGLVTVTGRPAGSLLRFAVGRPVIPGREALDDLRRDEGGRHDLGQAGAGERLADGVADLERIGSVGRHRRVRAGVAGTSS